MNTTNLVVAAYLIYLPIAFILIAWSARMLFKNGFIFMMDIFHGNEALAKSTNRLFEVGYFLLNVGFALMILKMNDLFSNREMIEVLSSKIGGFTIYLGVIFMVNVILFMKGRKHVRQAQFEREMIAKKYDASN
jgi:hypothetical protein